MIMSLSWLDWLGLSMVLVLLCVLTYVIWRRKRTTKDKSKPVVLAEPSLAPNRLLKIWRSFIRSIPWRLRSNALAVPLSLVIGEAGCGKTEIIDEYAEWHGQDFCFNPSAIGDSLLQIYQGVDALVLEFSSSLLYDTNRATYQAMRKLWQHLPTDPQAVVVIDVTTLLNPQPERLRLSGRALLGKLKVFGELENAPLPLTLALTHMENVHGFVEFCTFLETVGIPLQIEFPEGDGINRLESCLDDFQQYLSRALVSCPAQDYLKIVNFLDEAPRLLGVLSVFLHQAGLHRDKASSPVIRLCLLSKQVHSFGCAPFARSPNFIARPTFTLTYHAKAALVLLLVGVSYFIGSYYYQKMLLIDIMNNVKTVRTTPVELYPEKISSLFLDFSPDLNKNALLTFQPNFFPKIIEYSNHLLIREIRTYYLIPLLKQAQFEPDSIFKTIKLLSLLYAKPDNDMGRLILTQLQENPTDYMIKYRLLISEYIMNNVHTNELDVPLNDIDYTLSKVYAEKNSFLLSLLQKIDIIFKKQTVEDVELAKIFQQSSEFLKFIDELNSHTNEQLMMGWLQQNTGLAINLQYFNDEQMAFRQKPLEQLLRLINDLGFSDTDVCTPNDSINQCVNQIKIVTDNKINLTPLTMSFSLNDKHFSYSNTEWVNFLAHNRIVTMLHNIIRNHQNYNGWAFFDSLSYYPNVEMNGSNNGEALFTGKARIDGHLSVVAFEKQVKPTIMLLSEVIAKLPISENEKKYFNDFVLTHLRVYTDNYVNAYLNYFQQLQVRINSVWELDYILSQIQQSNSPLLETLLQIKNNTLLNLSASPYLEPFAKKLMAFRYINQLMVEKDGSYPEFQKYQIIMAKMQNDLNSRELYLPSKTDGNAAGLKGALSPIGRGAWSMLLNEDSSYAKQVKNWLQNAGIPKKEQQPFLAPVQKVEELGAVEIKQAIDFIWADIWNSNVQPLFVNFPFQPDAGKDKELSTDDLIKTFHPKQGVFWVTFQQYLAPLCNFNNGFWIQRQELSDNLTLPTGFLNRLNAIQQLTAKLWDKEGNPIPLQLSVKPELMPAFDSQQIPNAPLVSLTYLRNGGASVLGFNQQATWHKLPLEWWTVQPAETGMEFRKDDGATQVYADITINDSHWNFYRLLQQGKSTGNTHYQWLLAHPDFPEQKLNLEFTFQNNPWIVFTNLAGS